MNAPNESEPNHLSLELHADTARERMLKVLFGIGMAVMTILALVVTLISFVDKSNLRHDLAAANRRFETITESQAAQLNCGRRYQDVVDEAQTDLLIGQVQLVVIIATVPAGTPERATSVGDKIAELDMLTAKASKAVQDKTKYNDDGSPLPCPLG